jgi:Ca2+/H+ antiporter, TMEM165/GDT1 family
MNNMNYRIKRGILFVPLFIGGVFLFGLIVMLLWNAVLPAAIPAIKAISYWQALGLFALSKIFFGFNRGWGGRHQQWKQRMGEKWNNMTPEERENFKAEWKDRCGGRWGRNTKTDSSNMTAE